jgi:predicted DNA-binding protein
MERTNIFLPLKMKAALKRLSKSTGASVAELVRRAVDAMLNKQ